MPVVTTQVLESLLEGRPCWVTSATLVIEIVDELISDRKSVV